MPPTPPPNISQNNLQGAEIFEFSYSPKSATSQKIFGLAIFNGDQGLYKTLKSESGPPLPLRSVTPPHFAWSESTLSDYQVLMAVRTLIGVMSGVYGVRWEM